MTIATGLHLHHNGRFRVGTDAVTVDRDVLIRAWSALGGGRTLCRVEASDAQRLRVRVYRLGFVYLMRVRGAA